MKKLLSLSLMLSTLCVGIYGATPRGFKIANGGFTNSAEVEEALREVQYIDNGIIVTYNFESAHIQPNVYDENASTWHIDGFSQMIGAGLPDLPQKHDLFYIGSRYNATVELIDCKYKDYNIKIGPAHLEDYYETENSTNTISDRTGFYPSSPISELTQQQYRNYSIFGIQIFPAQYDVEREMLRAYTELRFKITYSDSPARVRKSGTEESTAIVYPEDEFPYRGWVTPLDENELYDADTAANLNDIESSGSGVQMAKPYGYLILTVPELLQSAHKLREWKTLLGFEARVISEPAWTPETVKTAISNSISDFQDLQYVMILGSHNQVPATQYGTYSSFISDYPYVCFDGENDYIADCKIGRIDMDNQADCDRYINRLVRYELKPPTLSLYYNRVVVATEFRDEDRNGYDDQSHCWPAEHTSKYLEDQQNKSIFRLYRYVTNEKLFKESDPDFITAKFYDMRSGWGLPLESPLSDPDFQWRLTASNLFKEINKGVNFVLYNGHGGADQWGEPYLQLVGLHNFNNEKYPTIFYNISCSTGDFSQDCFCSNLINQPDGRGGAIGAIGSTGMPYIDDCAVYLPGLISAMFPSPGLEPSIKFAPNAYNPVKSRAWRLADIMQTGLLSIDISGLSPKRFRQMFHCFGDPAMKVYVSNPYSTAGGGMVTQSFVTIMGNTVRISNSTSPLTVYDTWTKEFTYYPYGISSFSNSNPNRLIIVENNNQKVPRVYVGENAILNYLDINLIK